MAAVTSSKSADTAEVPQTETLRRLTADCAGYLGKTAGEKIPVSEIEKQAETNGYTKREFQQILENADVATESYLIAPERDGSIFGELWKPDSEKGGVPTPDCTKDSDPSTLSQFSEWLEQKYQSRNRVNSDWESRQYPVEHAFSRKAENQRYARACDVDRFYQQKYQTFSTVMLTFVAEREAGETPVEHAEKFYPKALMNKIRYELRKRDVWAEASGVNLLAPRGPRANRTKPLTHAHTFLWLPGGVTEEMFHKIIDKHIEKVDGATEENHPVEEAVKVQVHDSDSVNSPSGVDASNGHTTALPVELGNNLPLLSCQIDARGCPDYITEWAAQISAGSDGKHSTKGINRFRTMGKFSDAAETVRQGREEAEEDAGEPTPDCITDPSPADESATEADEGTTSACQSTDSREDDAEEEAPRGPKANRIMDDSEDSDGRGSNPIQTYDSCGPDLGGFL